MLRRSIIFLVLLGWCQSHCTQSIPISSLDAPQRVSLPFTRSDNTQRRRLCFSYQAPSDLGSLALRLDYLPYLCVLAQNDNAMSRHGQHYFVEVQVSRKCFSLWEQEQTIQFVYELRKGQIMAGLLVYDLMWQYGAIGLAVAAGALWLDQRGVRLEKEE